MKEKLTVRLFRAPYGSITATVADMSEYDYVEIAPSIDVELDFNVYDEGTIIKNEVYVIDNKINKIRESSLREIMELNQKKQKLLAITQDKE